MTEPLRPMRISSGAIFGFVVGAFIGIVVGNFPVFHWEMAGLVVLVFTTIAGAIAGGVAAKAGLLLGALSAGVSIGTLFFFLAVTGSMPTDDPWGIPIWGTVVIVGAAGSAAAVTTLRRRIGHRRHEN